MTSIPLLPQLTKYLTSPRSVHASYFTGSSTAISGGCDQYKRPDFSTCSFCYVHPSYQQQTTVTMAMSVAAAAAASATSSKTSFLSSNKHPLCSLFASTKPTNNPASLKFPTQNPQILTLNHSQNSPLTPLSSTTSTPSTATTTFHGQCYVLPDNIDTDQIIPAEHLTLVPSNPEEYKKLGSFALVGLPASYTTRFIEPGQTQTNYSIIIAGANFGCGSSREHAPVALGAAGVTAVVAESYARIFFRNSVATGEIYPVESEGRLCDECNTGDVVTIELEECRLFNHTTGKEYKLKPIGDAGPVIEAGGIFAYARKTGMIAA